MQLVDQGFVYKYFPDMSYEDDEEEEEDDSVFCHAEQVMANVLEHRIFAVQMFEARMMKALVFLLAIED